MKNILMWALLFFGAVYLFGQFRTTAAENSIPYSEFMRRAEEGLFVRVHVDGTRLQQLDAGVAADVTGTACNQHIHHSCCPVSNLST